MKDDLAKTKLISIICPVYNEQACVPIFYNHLQSALAKMKPGYEFELIFINNRSTDKTLEAVLELRKKDPCVQVITMSRNFGYQASAQAGMTSASGDAVIVIDVDCEDPPELILKFIAKWEEGYEVVYGIRKERSEPLIIKKMRDAFYHLLKMTADMDIILYMAEFALVSSVVRDVMINNQNTFPFLRAEIGYAGFSRFGIPYKRQPRVAGKTHYRFLHMVSFGWAGLLTSSTFLMRLAVYIFPVFIFLNAILLFSSIFLNSADSFKALVAMDFTYVCFLLTSQGVYIARIYKNGIGRPIFIIDHKLSYINNGIFLNKNKGLKP